MYMTIYDIWKENAKNSDEDLSGQPFPGILGRNSFLNYLLSCSANGIPVSAVAIIGVDNRDELRKSATLERCDSIVNAMGVELSKYISRDLIAAKYGDFTYVVALHDIDDMSQMITRLQMIKNSLRLTVADAEPITCSIGACPCSLAGIKDARQGLESAHKACIEAEIKGGDRVLLSDLPGRNNKFHVALEQMDREVFARSFGYFDLFIDGKPVDFHSAKAKEYLAFLIDRRGGLVSASEAITALWEDEPVNDQTLSRLRKVIYRLNEVLRDNGLESIIRTVGRKRCVDTKKLRCDLFDYLSGRELFRSLYKGEYMLEYSWAEETVPMLENVKNNLEKERKGTK